MEREKYRRHTTLTVSWGLLTGCILLGWLLKHYGPITQIGAELGMDMTVRNACMLLNLMSVECEAASPLAAEVRAVYMRAVGGGSRLLTQNLIWLYSRLGHVYVIANALFLIELIKRVRSW